MQHRSDYLQSSTTSNELPIPITDQALSNDELKEVVTDSVNCLGYCSANTTINRLGARVFFGAGSDRQLLVPQLFDVPYSPEQISAASTQLERTKIASLTNTTAHTHVIQTFGLRVVNPVDPYADLRQFARNKLKLKGQQLAVVESLCDAGGELSIADLAHCEGVGWNNPKKQFEDLQRRLNPKIKPYGWRIERHDGAARLFKLPVEQPAKDP